MRRQAPDGKGECSFRTQLLEFSKIGISQAKLVVLNWYFVSVASTEEEVEQALEEVVATMHPDEP